MAEFPGTADARNPFCLLAFHPKEAVLATDFLDSHFINTQELPQLLAAAETEGLTLLWVHARKC